MRKAISPLIGIVLLVVTTVALSLTITQYLTSTTKTFTEQAGTEIKVGNKTIRAETCPLQSIKIMDYYISQPDNKLRVLIRNDGTTKTYIKSIIAYDENGMEWIVYSNESGDELDVNEEKVYTSQQEKPAGFGNVSRIRASTFCPGVYDVYKVEEVKAKQPESQMQEEQQSKQQKTWLAGFAFRREIIINNTQNSNNLTDYQIAINVSYDPDMQPDFDDLRFTWYNETSKQEIKLAYWIENKSDSSWAYVWVKVPYIPSNTTDVGYGSGIQKIWMYYGNNSVGNESDLNAVGDDLINPTFDVDLSGWEQNMWGSDSGDIIWDNGRARLRVYKCYNVELYQTDFAFLGNTLTYDWESKADKWYEYPNTRIFVNDTQVYTIGHSPGYAGTKSGEDIITIEHSWKFGKAKILFAIYQSQYCSNSDHANTYYWIDNVHVKVRKYVSPEPTVTIGSEESYS